MEKLKPCPFCGGKAVLWQVTEKLGDGESLFYICCEKCLSKTGRWYEKKNVIDMWNRRDESCG